MKNLSLIACVSSDLGLGRNGDLLWRFPEDQRFFRQTTLDHPIIMGRRTFASIGKALPRRENLVLTHRALSVPGVQCFASFEELNRYLQTQPTEKFVIGGQKLYEYYLPLADTLYLTEVEACRTADVFFPKFTPDDFERTVLKKSAEDGISFQIVRYDRKVAR